jgi:hypothetical protein
MLLHLCVEQVSTLEEFLWFILEDGVDDVVSALDSFFFLNKHYSKAISFTIPLLGGNAVA